MAVYCDPTEVKVVGQGHTSKFTAMVKGTVRMHVTIGGCSTAGGLWRMKLNYGGHCYLY